MKDLQLVLGMCNLFTAGIHIGMGDYVSVAMWLNFVAGIGNVLFPYFSRREP